MKQQYDINEIINDINLIDDNKKAIAAKYGIESNKAAVIEQELWIMANNIRREHKTFSRQDIRIYNHCWNVPYSAKKIRETMAEESTEFVQFYLDCLLEQIGGRKVVLSTDRTRIATLQSIIDERRSSSDTVLQSLIATLTAQTSEFHAKFIEMAMTNASGIFDYLMSKYKDLNSIADIVDKYGDIGHERLQKIWKNAARAKAMTFNFDKKAYMIDAEKSAERNFSNSIQLIAQRIKDAGMDQTAIQVTNISDHDAKAFDIHVTDGQRSMHARSIFAAENSTIVTPHFRFIITNE